ncbi:MAG: signal peptidase I [Parcubacteria group bacterium Gr01-1014_44]|nr:MAG: signal peptidase I [Parcubacteria group bacterium Gr01-1014_44]
MTDFEEQRGPNRKEFVSFFWELIKVVLISLAIVIPVRYFLFQPFFVKGASMEPTFNDGDYVLIDEVSYRFRDPQRGEVVIFRSPQDRSQFFIKRVIGLPGEKIQISNNKITLFNQQNQKGFVLDESFYLDPGAPTMGNLQDTMNENNFFVLGDNRSHSSDSRLWGAVDRKLITGRVMFRAWPLDKIAKFEPVVYPVD